ncbi:MAG: hypothetical protein DMF61_22460 [Blastocatellia bacterium AA13]|nr:MAG: hypothetical protein DMF61_22460 [Blastocatellia bacterium AA13]
MLIILLLSVSTLPGNSKPVRVMALTFDDLPFVELEQAHDLARVQDKTKKLIRTLREHRAPAIGFVNEAKLNVSGEISARTDLLEQWVDAGFILGNHTYSHPDLNALRRG